MRVGDLVKFRENEEWKIGLVVNTWKTHTHRVQSVDIMVKDRIIPRLRCAVRTFSESAENLCNLTLSML